MSPLHLFEYFSTQNNNNNTYIHTVQERVLAIHYYIITLRAIWQIDIHCK